MGVLRLRLRPQTLLLLALLCAAALGPHAAAAKNDTTGADAAAQTGKGGDKAAAAGEAPPPPKKKNRKRPPPPLPVVEAPAPAPQVVVPLPLPSPQPLPSPLPSPALAPAAAPLPVPSPSPVPAPAAAPTVAPPPSPAPVDPANLLKIIMKIEGATYPLTDQQLQGTIYAINNYTTPVLFSARWQQPSSPNSLPLVDNNVTIYPPPPPPKGHKKHSGSSHSSSGGGGGSADAAVTAPSPIPVPEVPVPAAAPAVRRMRRMLQGLEGQARRGLLQDAAAQWWPQQDIPTPLDADGVYVFADAQAVGLQQQATLGVLGEATSQGLLCDSLNNNGVTCTMAVIAAQGVGVGSISVFAGAGTAATTATSGGGLSTGALIGIIVGGAVGVAIIAMVVLLFVSWRRERVVSRAAAQRMRSRRSDYMPDQESKWRQTYSARMAESVRRAEEAAERQKVQSRGPSFVEAQDRAFAEQAAAQTTPQLTSKMSFGRGTPQTPTAELSSMAKLERESPGHSLMSGSELSSPPPSVASSGRKKSFRGRLFGSGGK